ncbi:MAG: glycosyltransferase [Mameliella sp.]|nr:glycosyltransferase [Phaeodactylibacter sp.]
MIMLPVGLSILIPVYNYDVSALVHALREQGEQLPCPFEVLCWDDGSSPEFQRINSRLGALSGVTYQLMPENLGRSRIRNRLADAAQFEYLLFMDCDSEVPNKDYLKVYQQYCRPDRLLYGGRIYQDRLPENSQLRFHWHYGSHREVQTANERQLQPYHSFMTNNFLIPKTIFDPIRFDERLTQYGHEDTLFGIELKERGIKIIHLNNPLIHAGLETGEVFIRKSVQAIENLAFLYTEGSPIETRLLKVYEKIRSWGLTALLTFVLPLFLPGLKAYLLNRNTPDLRAFDLYKLGVLLKYLKKA